MNFRALIAITASMLMGAPFAAWATAFEVCKAENGKLRLIEFGGLCKSNEINLGVIGAKGPEGPAGPPGSPVMYTDSSAPPIELGPALSGGVLVNLDGELVLLGVSRNSLSTSISTNELRFQNSECEEPAYAQISLAEIKPPLTAAVFIPTPEGRVAWIATDDPVDGLRFLSKTNNDPPYIPECKQIDERSDVMAPVRSTGINVDTFFVPPFRYTNLPVPPPLP